MNTEPVNTAGLSEPIVKGGGDSPSTWDELEAVGRYKKEVKKVEKKEEKEVEKSVSKPKAEKKDDSSKESGPAKKEVSKSKDEPEKPAEKKRLRVKHGDSELDLDLDLELPVKVDGKEGRVKLQEALSNYSSRKHLDEKYQSLKKEMTDFNSQRDQLNSIVKKAQESLKAKDFRSFMEMVGEATGEDPKELYANTVQSLRTQLEEAAHLSPEERKLKELEEEISYYKRKEEQSQQEVQRKQSFQQTAQKVEAVMSKTGMDKSSFIKAFDELIEMGYKADDLTPEQVGDYHHNFKITEAIDRKLAAVNPELRTEKLIMKIAKYALNLNLSEKGVETFIERKYSKQAVKKLSAEVRDREKKARSEQPIKNPDKDPTFFGDL